MRILHKLGVLALSAGLIVSSFAAAAQDVALSGKKIGIAARETTGDYNQDLIAGAKSVLEAAGAQVVVTDAGTDARKQNENIESLIQSGVSGIIIQLGDAQQLAPVVATANAAGIPVVSTSIGARTDGVLADVSGDDAMMAAMMGRALLSSINYEGNVYIFWVPGAPLLETRKRVFEALAADYPKVTLHEVSTDFSPASAQSRMEDLLTANPEPGSIAAVWGAYDLLVSGAVQAIRSAGRNEIKTASIDGDRIGFQMLLSPDSPQIATVVQDVSGMGATAANILVQAIGGKTDFPSTVFSSAWLATHANGVAAAEKRYGANVWESLGIAKADVEARWPQDADVVVVQPVLP
jgi:ribose transport system substrate-binding protein